MKLRNKPISALFAWILVSAMLMSMLPMSVFAYSEDYFYDEETSIDVSTDGKVYSIYTEDYLDEQNGMTFLYVVKRGDRYYTPGNPRYTEFKEVDSVYAVDITEYYDAQTNTFSGISNNVNVGVMQYQQNSGSYMYLDGDMLFALSVPFESKGETWFDGGIRYYPPDETYSYSRPLWQANGDGTGYLYDSYIDWYSDSDLWVYGVLDLKFDGINYRFALRDKSAEYNEAKAADPDNYDISVDVTAYLYAAPCGHEQNIHSEAVAPTCMDKGCEEYWYCRLCGGYFADSQFSKEIGHIPVLPALDHTYGPEGCINCGRSTPVYTKVTSYDQFRTLDPNASFIAVAEIDNGNGGKDYYVLKKEIGTTMADIDEDGNPDILQIDENGNGVADVLEIDANGDGIPDAMDYDGCYDGEPDGVLNDDEIWEYLFYLEREYTDGYIPGIHVLSAIPVTPAADGSISVLGLDALEWIMERKISDEELYDQYYDDGATVKDYENDFCFRIPNFWIRSVVTIDNNFYQQPYDQGDSKWWGVLFGKDGKELYDLLYGEDYPDDAVILYTEAFYSLNTDGQLGHPLRFLINGEEKNFIMTSDSFWDEIEGTQYPIYLYCSDAGQPVHEHVWSSWTKVNDNTHKRVCTVEGCTVFDLASHNKDESKGCTPDEDNYQLGHWVTCADCESDYHEYHTRKTLSGSYKDYWEDTDDGIYHVIYCTECEGPVEYKEHTWTNWWIQIDANGKREHMRRCTTYACYRYEYREADDHIYTITVTTEPTCLTPGVKTYTCIADECTHSYTEEIPATGHDWGEWTPHENDATKEIRICKNDPTHTEERLAHEHEWSEWKNDEVSETHSRTCGAENCPVGKETAPHNWNDGVQIGTPTCTEGAKMVYTCDDCGATYEEDVDCLGHDFGEWDFYDENTHRMTCSVCNYYTEEEHSWDNGVETVSPTCYSTGVMTYTCGTCDYVKTEDIPVLEHTFTDWAPNGDETHKRECMDDNCDAIETLDHSWDDGEITKEPTCKEVGVKTYTCQTCMHTKTEDLPILDHEFGEWTPNNDGKTHSHFCSCGEAENEDHNFNDGEVTQAPTHEAVGEKKYTCSDCGYSYTEEIPVLTDHVWGEWIVNKLDEANTHIRYCVCDEVDKAAHNFDNGRVTTEPTHTSKGVKIFTCGDCGYSYTEDISELEGHTFGEWTPEATVTGMHYRECACGERENGDCTWDEGVIGVGTIEGSYFIDYTCTVCGAHNTKDVRGAQVRYDNCEGLNQNPVIFIQTAEEATYQLTLPTVQDIAAREGYVLIGWKASTDGVTYAPGADMYISYADTPSITFSAVWAQVIGEGEQELSEDQAYMTDMEAFELEGEGVTYQGDQVFYVPKSGIYALIDVKNDKEVE